MLLPALAATPQRDPTLDLQPESRLWVSGTSTVRAFQCQAGAFDAKIESTGADAVAAVLAGEKAVSTIEVTVPAEKLDCRNGTMNEHMRKALKADVNPQITWTLTSYEVQGANVVINGKLTIAGKENSIELRGTGSAENGTIRFKGSKQFRMTEYGVKPPSLMLGTMKVGDPITVSFDLVLSE